MNMGNRPNIVRPLLLIISCGIAILLLESSDLVTMPISVHSVVRATEHRKEPPKPVILMSLGRSGSSAVFETMTAMAGQQVRGYEIAGSDIKQSFKYLKEHTDGRWLLDYVREQQEEYPNAGIVGFKWKPHVDSMALPGARVALEKARLAGIQVLYSRRNPLDVSISSAKHRAHKHSLHAHCRVNDTVCIEKHRADRVTLPVNSLFEQLQEHEAAHIQAQKLLQETQVSYFNTTYESLFFGGDMTDRWMEIFRFVGVGPMEGLTKQQIESAMSTAYTSTPHHADLLANYDEVTERLRGTAFESLLH